MTKAIRAVFAILLFTMNVSSQSKENPAEQVDLLMAQAIEKDVFSGNVLIAHEGKIIYQKSFGYADWEMRTPLNDSTMFNIGSNGKDFTQVLICQLVQENKLAFNDPLSKYLNMFPKSIADKITVKQLLTMQSGMGDYMQSPRFRFGQLRTISSLLDFIKDEPLLFEPGSDRAYSNSGYVVLGGIIEKITGKSYEQNVLDRILGPLNMSHSRFIYPDSKNIQNKATGTEISLSNSKRTEQRINPGLVPTSAGGMYASAPDLLRFYEAEIYTNQLLNDELKLKLFTRYDDQPKSTWKEMLSDPRFISALAGGLNGWNSCVTQIPASHYTVIVLSNYDDAGQPAEEVSERIQSIILGKPYEPLEIPLPQFIYQYISKNGLTDFYLQFNKLIKDNRYKIRGPMVLNRLGYDLINEKKLDWAVAIFKVNIQLFPDEPNGYDSLGEAYLLNGQKELAIQNYKKVLEMDPENRNAKQMLEKMK
ncbi:serine hydrolase [bacterium]|nr:serine hydrolase [bacterium]